MKNDITTWVCYLSLFYFILFYCFIYFYYLVKRLAEHKDKKYIEVAPKEVCKDMSHLESFYQDIVDKGGEGIILRDPVEMLRPGRSPGYLKHKVI